MSDDAYKLITVVGQSKKSFADACQHAVKRASKSLRGLSWFEVAELRGRVADGKIEQYQATIRIGFKLD